MFPDSCCNDLAKGPSVRSFFRALKPSAGLEESLAPLLRRIQEARADGQTVVGVHLHRSHHARRRRRFAGNAGTTPIVNYLQETK